MKKFFTLLTLLVGIYTGAWGTNTTLIDGYTLADLPATALDLSTQTMFTTDNCVDANGNIVIAPIYWNYGSEASYTECPMKGATWFSANAYSNSGDTWSSPSASVFKGSDGWPSSFRRRLNVRKTERNYAVRFKGCEGISILGAANGQVLYLSVFNLSSGVIGSLVETADISGNDKVATVSGLNSTKEYVAYIYCSTGTNSSLHEIAFLAPTGTPTINAANTTITTTTSGVDATENIAITGANLTASGTLTATLSPAVTGLSVDLASNSIGANGAISTTATLTYNATANATGETTLVLSDGTTTKNVKITYLAQVTAWSLQTISTAKTWDFSTLSGGKQYSGDDLTVEHVYANINEITCPSGFDGTALAFTGEYPLRSGKGIAQNGTLKFRTSVPGTINVTFSDTGTSASSSAVKRYLVVNGVQTAFWTSRENNGSSPYAAQLNVETDAIAVPAGEVTITGSSAIVISKLSFIPIPGPADPTDNGSTITIETTANMDGYRAFYDASQGYTLDDDTKAYVATAQSGSNITMTPINNVPAGTPVILKTTAASHTMTLTKATPAAYTGTNLLEVTVANANVDGYRLGYNSTDGVAFYPYQTNSASAGIIYLNVAVSARALNFSFEDEDVTGISEAKSQQQTANSQFFDLSGRRVAQPTKGLYIVNGKKVVIK